MAPDRERVQETLTRLGVESLAAVFTLHSHYDHALDAPTFARLTGALLVSGNRFFQVLEGKAEAVNKTLKRIGDDPRHKDVKQVWAGQSSGRMFDGWAMVAVAADPENRINISRTIDEAVDYPAAAISTLLKLVNRQRR